MFGRIISDVFSANNSEESDQKSSVKKSSSFLYKHTESKPKQTARKSASMHSLSEELDLHEQHNLERISSVSQLASNDSIQVILHPSHSLVSSSGSMSSKIVEHVLEVKSYRTFTFCDHCGELLWGLVKQGVRCKICKRNYHKRCAHQISKICDLGQRGSGSSTSSFSPTAPSSPGASNRVPHSLIGQTFKSKECCTVCQKIIAKGTKGYKCQDCRTFACSKKCSEKLPKNCTGETMDTLAPEIGQDRLGTEASADSDKSGQSTDGSHKYGYNENVSDDEDAASPLPIKEVHDMKLEEQANQNLHFSYGKAQVPLQRVANSVRRPRAPPSMRGQDRMCLLHEGWLVHYTNQSEARMRYFWRLTTKEVQLYSDEQTQSEGKASKRPQRVIPISEILKVEQGQHHESRTPVLRIITSQLVFHVMEDTSVSQKNNTITKWSDSFTHALRPYVTQNLSILRHHGAATPGSTPEEKSSLGPKNSFHWSRDSEDQHAESIQDIYKIDMDDILGAGQFGTVYSARHRRKRFEVAIKCVDKKRFPQKENQQLRHEVTVLSGLDHPGIVKIYNMFETPNQVFVVMEKLHGDMLELILGSEAGKLCEADAKFLTYQIVIALRYLHKRCVVHCDLKPENVLILGCGDQRFQRIKLCDFGFARIIGEKSFRTSVVGTPAYLAPEVLRNEGYNRSLDMWSVGVIIYVTLSGTFPFNEDEDINDQIENAEFMFPRSLWIKTSCEAIDLIKALLQVKRRRRLSVDKMLSHSWMQNCTVGNYELWLRLRALERMLDEKKRFLTHPSDDERWAEHANNIDQKQRERAERLYT